MTLQLTHEMTLRLNYFTSLTLLCGGLRKGDTHVYVAPWERRHTSSAIRLECAMYDRMCGVLAMKDVTPKESHTKGLET